MAKNEPDDMTEEQLWEAFPASEGFRRADILGNLGRQRMNDHDYDNAATFLEEAIVEFTKVDAYREIAFCTFLLSRCISHEGRHAEARDMLLSIMQMPGMHDHEMELAHAMSNAAEEMKSLGDYEGALAAMEQAIEYFQMVNSDQSLHLTECLINLASFLNHVGGRNDEAVTALEAAVEYAGQTGSTDVVATTRLSLAYALLNQCQYDEALKQCKMALTLTKVCSCKVCTAEALVCLISVYQSMGQDSLLRQTLTELEEFASQHSLAKHRAYGIMARAEMVSQTDPVESRRLADEALVFFESFHDETGMELYHSFLSQLAQDEGNLELALQHQQICVDAIGKDTGIGKSESLKRNLARLQLEAGKHRNALVWLGTSPWLNEETDSKSVDRFEHSVLYAQALLADGQLSPAKLRAQQVLKRIEGSHLYQLQAESFEVIAYADRLTDPLSSDNAAKRAMANYVLGDDSDSAKRIATEFFSTPYAYLSLIAGDNDRRANNDESRAVLELISTPDPIVEQVLSDLEGNQEPEADHGIA